MAIAPGARFDRYEILSLLGKGGMGEVHLAQDTKLGRKIALKLLPAQFTQDADRVRRFVQEARAASALNHPNIITIHEIGEVEGTHFIATEFIDGRTLRRRMTQEKLGLSETLDVAIQVASALAAAHEAGIVHRDIKPENVMLRPDGYVKVLDFGLAKLTERQVPAADTEAPTSGGSETDPGTVMGTAQYMSPEQARGQKVDARTDIFSLGVVLYEMAAGRAPFEGVNAVDVLGVILNREPAPLKQHATEVPTELERIVTKALRKNREERYQTVKDLLLDLKSLKQDVELEARLGYQVQAGSSGEVMGNGRSAQAAVRMTEKPTVPTAEGATARATSSAEYLVSGIREHQRSLAFVLLVLLLVAAGLSYWFFARRSANTAQIESIAVLPFVNASGNSEVEYLSDGMTESLINSLSQLPHLSVKARSTVFRYKGKDLEPQKVGNELSVQAVLNGRVVERGGNLTLSLELVEARTGNQIWGEKYDRKLADLVSLQSDIARDVSQKLRVRLSGADERKLAKNYTENVEAYQLYLKGHYYVTKLTPSDMQTGISYFQRAIDIDPSYALAYVGLADAYRRLTFAFDRPSTEVLPKAKAAAQKAIELDETLAEAHAGLGFTIFWYDWNVKEAENQLRRAIELNPNSADTHESYAHLLSETGRHAEGLATIKRARELDPLNLRINALEGQFLIHAGHTDEALARLQKTLELDPNFWLTHLFFSSAYIEKGRFAEAVAAARKARELAGMSTQPIAFAGYALAKSGKGAEARAAIEELLKLSTDRYVPPYNIALIYNGLSERGETLAWLERAFEQRDTRMIFLKVEPKWNNLRSEPRFQYLLRRVGLTP